MVSSLDWSVFSSTFLTLYIVPALYLIESLRDIMTHQRQEHVDQVEETEANQYWQTLNIMKGCHVADVPVVCRTSSCGGAVCCDAAPGVLPRRPGPLIFQLHMLTRPDMRGHGFIKREWRGIGRCCP